MEASEQNLAANNMSGQNQEGSNANWPVKILTATSIIGDGIENPQGEHLGKIKDIMLDIDKELFEKAPGFDQHQWPATNSHEYLQG